MAFKFRSSDHNCKVSDGIETGCTLNNMPEVFFSLPQALFHHEVFDTDKIGASLKDANLKFKLFYVFQQIPQSLQKYWL